MKTVKYVPEVCGPEGMFEGSLEMRLPTFDERYSYLEKLSASLDAEGNIMVGKGDNKTEQIRNIRVMVKLSEAHYVSVNIKNKKTGEELKSFSDLSTDDDAHAILIEVATKLFSGFKLGNG